MGRLAVAGCVADLFEGSLDQVFALVAQAVVDGSHGLDHAGGRSGKGELAVGHLAAVESEGTVAKDYEAAVGERAGVVFMEIEDDFFIGELVVADFHWFSRCWLDCVRDG